MVVGDTAFVDVPRLLSLLHPRLPSLAAIAFSLLPPTLVVLAEPAAPKQSLIDFRGSGQCGPNTLASLLRLVNKYDGSGRVLREIVATCVKTEPNQHKLTSFKWN